jgi:hypothetical protein
MIVEKFTKLPKRKKRKQRSDKGIYKKECYYRKVEENLNEAGTLVKIDLNTIDVYFQTLKTQLYNSSKINGRKYKYFLDGDILTIYRIK